MTYNSKAKLKVLYLRQILEQKTDAEHGLTMPQIIEELAAYDVQAERKSIYDDIKALQEFGVDVEKRQRNPVEYAIERRGFTLDELMLMVDAIQSCRSITESQAKKLVTNIKQLASNYEQDALDRRIHVQGRIKSKNESVFPSIDVVHKALRLRCKMEFSYRRMGTDGKLYETRDGKKHLVTPVSISYEDGFYYLAAWNEKHGDIAQYRFDRMARVHALEDLPATRNEAIASYRREAPKAVMFGRFGGQEVTATLEADAGKVDILVDRFGSAATFLKGDASYARARVKVYKSEQFFGWVASMGKHVRIVKPDSLVEEYKEYLRRLLED